MKQREDYLLSIGFRHKGVYMLNGLFTAFNTNNWVHIWHNDKLIAEDVRTVAELKKALEPYMELINEQNKKLNNEKSAINRR